MDILREIERVIYEIKNARRGSYADLGDTQLGFVEGIKELGENLSRVCTRALDEMPGETQDHWEN